MGIELREKEIIEKIQARFGTPRLARAWYESEPLSGFDEVLDYEAVDSGIHA